MKVNRLIFREMGTYNDMPMRSFSSEYTPHLRMQLDEATSGGQHIAPSVLAGFSGQILRPKAQVDGVANIANGWGERRFLFIMEVEINRSTTAVSVMVITGHTDHCDISAMDSRAVRLDPEMRLYFDNCFELRHIDMLDRNGPTRRSSISENCQILNRRTRATFNTPGRSNGTITITPEDLFITNTVPSKFTSLANQEGFRDMRSGFNRGPLKLSKRINTQSSQYLSRTLRAGLNNRGGNDFLSDDTDGTQGWVGARGDVKEPLVSSNAVLSKFQEDTNIMSDGFVTYRSLCYRTPDIDDRTDVIRARRDLPMHSRGQSEGWGGADTETLAATIVAQTVPTMLMENMYSEIYFTCTNDTQTGEFVTQVGNLIPFIPETDIDENFNRLIGQIEHTLMPDLVLNNQIIVTIGVHCAIYGETSIEISVDGAPVRPYTFPTFCEAVLSPMLTEDMGVRDMLARDISDIIDSLDTSTGSAPTAPAGRGNLKDGGFL